MRLYAEEIIKCPRCGIPMVQDDGHWKCPLCDGEWWESETRAAIIAAELRCAELLERGRACTHNVIGYGMSHFVPLPAGVPVRGKSSRSGRRRKKTFKRMKIGLRQLYFYQ